LEGEPFARRLYVHIVGRDGIMSTGVNVAAADGVGVMSWLACRVSSHVCALPLTGIIETMRPLPIEAFPRAPSFVSGLAVIRGAPTPVVDMRALMGEAAGSVGRLVAVKIKERVVALAVDAVIGVHHLSTTRATALPPLLKNVAGDAVSAVSVRDAELLLFFESARIFPPGLLDGLMSERAAP
jgi:purine-binding chemotaxis protein CheW